MNTNAFNSTKHFESSGSNEEMEPPGTGLCLEVIEPLNIEKFIQKGSIGNLFNFNNNPFGEDVNQKTESFRKRFYSDVSREEWDDWRWQISNRIQDIDTLEFVLRLSEEESDALNGCKGGLPFSITPYYASLLDQNDPTQPLRRTVVPVRSEFYKSPQEAEDPLNEEHHTPVLGIVHRYPDRVLFLVTDFCSTYCRYCTRSRMVGHRNISQNQLAYWKNAIAYIKDHMEIRDVLLSGGDPLTLSDERLEWLLFQLHRIPHIEMLRIGTKVPMVLPQRITSSLTEMLRRYHPLWISIHVTHPDEITHEASQACISLADAGIPLGSQTVLLSGINDNVNTMKCLVQKLLKIRVRPYYLYQCDPVIGSSHFRTTVEKGLEIIGGLRGYTTGYAVPTYVIDAPGGGGKIPLFPNSVVEYSQDHVILKNYKGDIYSYPDNLRNNEVGGGGDYIL